MALCVNQSGTWREITTNCVNVSGTWRNIQIGCINQSGTWRCYGFFNIATSPLGSQGEGGYLICRTGGTAWIVAPSAAGVSRTWYSRNDAVTTANANAACGDWFVPTVAQLQDPGYICRTYWDHGSSEYWTSEAADEGNAYYVRFAFGFAPSNNKDVGRGVRAFRCVTY